MIQATPGRLFASRPVPDATPASLGMSREEFGRAEDFFAGLGRPPQAPHPDLRAWEADVRDPEARPDQAGLATRLLEEVHAHGRRPSDTEALPAYFRLADAMVDTFDAHLADGNITRKSHDGLVAVLSHLAGW